RNEVGVMSWDTEFIWDASVRSAKDRQAIHHAIATIKAGGGTDGYPALKESYAVLFDRPALLKHVIFLSDGQMTRGDFQGLLRRMAKDKITVSTVAIGKDADVQLMVDIAKWGRGRFYYTEDSQTIPRIFTLETQLVRWPLRSGSRSDTVALVERHDDVGEIVVDAVDTKGEFINFLDSQVGVVAPNRERTVIDLEQVGPGRYRGRFPVTQEGV